MTWGYPAAAEGVKALSGRLGAATHPTAELAPARSDAARCRIQRFILVQVRDGCVLSCRTMVAVAALSFDEDQHMMLRVMSWKDFEALLAVRGYLDGEIELVSTTKAHHAAPHETASLR
jgi:hypothetical protein